MLGQSKEYLRQLCRRLAFAEDDFRHSDAQRAMVIYFGKSQVFKGQVPQPLHGIVGGEAPSANILKEFADGFRVHSKPALSNSSQLSAVSIQSGTN